MAKKNKKKNQKQADWTSPPPSPKPVPEEPVPALPASLPLSPETAPSESKSDDIAQPLASPLEAQIDSKPVEEPASDPATQVSVVADAPRLEENSSKSKNDGGVRSKPEERIESKASEELEKEHSVIPNPGSATVPAQAKDEPSSKESSVLDQSPASQSDSTGKKEKEPVFQPSFSKPVDTQSTPSTKLSTSPSHLTGSKEQEVVSQSNSLKAVPDQGAPLTEASSPRSVEKSAVKEPEATTVTETPNTQSKQVEEPIPQAKPESVSVPEPAFEATKKPEDKTTIKPELEQKPEIVEAKSAPTARPASPLAPPPPPPAPIAAPSSPRSVASERSLRASAPVPLSPRSVTSERLPPTSARPKSPPKPDALNQVLEDSRPAAPTPPVTRARPRRSPVFDDDDEDDSALIHPRLRGEALSRDSSRGSTYPPPSQSRSVFASRVPSEPYSNPPLPPHAPPGYHHPRYYPPAPPAAPPYYHPSHHSMSQPSGYPPHNPYGPPPPPHSSSPYQESWGHGPPNYGPYGSQSPPQRHDSMGSRDYPMGPPAIENGSAIEDDSGDIFSRIAQAIPDLHVLLARYKETHGQLGVREELLRRADVEQQTRLRAKDEELHSLREKLKEEAAQLRLALDAAMKSFESRYKELEEAHALLEQTSAEEIAKARKEFDEWKSTATTKHDAEKIALAIQFDKKLKEADVLAENQRQEAAAAFVKEKDELRSEHQRQQREREANLDSVRQELENKLGAAQLDAEQALKRERESMEVWSKERGTLVQAHREDIESLRKSWDEQRSLLEGQHKKIKDESDKAWIDLHAEANRKAEEHKALAEQLAKDKEELQRLCNELRAETEKEKQVIKSVASNLETEKSRLEKLMECYGDIAEIKTKGDTYYLVSFSQLQKQILDLAATHFMHLPVRPPPEELAQIPSTLPSFLGETSASRQLRSAYVAHTVSKLITYRVFGPFLFSLGRRYDKADSLFSSMSNHIRDKSTRKEAIWRQQTLLAAFTSSGAKQRINTAAGTVVEEIVNAIKHFADPKEEEGIKIAVKRIVKLAAETWRFARLEREMVTAIMPALNDEEHGYTGPEFWPAYRPEGTPIPSLVGTAPPSDEQPKLLLRLFPVVYREPKHESLRDSNDEKPDDGCIFHHGLALYDDAEPVVQRAEELKAAGMPPVSTASPTAADFPPPLVPAPRDPPPPAPSSEKASVRSKTPQSVASEKKEKTYVRTLERPKSPPEMSDQASLRPKSNPPDAADNASVRSKSSSKAPPPDLTDKTSTRSKSPPLDTTDDVSIRSKSSSKAPPPDAIDKVSIKSKSPPPDDADNISIRSKPSQADEADKMSIRSKSSQPEADKTSRRSSIHPPPPTGPPPPPPPPPLEEPADLPPPPDPVQSVHSQTGYTRPIPGPIHFDTPQDIPPLPTQTESVVTRSGAPPSHASGIPPLPAPTESIAPPDPPPPPPDTLEAPPLPAPTESAIIPPFNPPESVKDSSSQGLPTPPHSRAATPSRPVSPLFAALDEIDALSSHRSRNSSSSRRPSRTKTSDEELRKDRPDTSRRTSGYSLSTRATDQGSIRTERTDRTDRTERTERSSGSRYMCESRSAAIKALYPNSPLAGPSPSLSRTNSVRSQKKRTEGGDAGTWDTDSQRLTSIEGNAEPSTS